MSRTRLVLTVVALGLPTALTAAVVLPYSFSNGQVADANQMNANFEALGNEIENRAGTLPLGTLGSPPFACGTAARGRMFLDTTTTTVYACTGTNFLALGGSDGSARERARTSCRSLRDAMPAAASGTYWIDPNGGSTDDAFQAYCEMSAGGATGWTMVAKYSAGVSGDALTLWSGGVQNEANLALLDVGADTAHYVNRLVGQYWNANGFPVSEALVGVYTGGTLRASIRFNAAGTNNTNWFAAANVTASTWTDLTPAQSYNVFGLAGDTANGRRFLVNNLYNGCANDVGWLVLQNAATTAPCSWELLGTPLRIRYANASTRQVWQTGAVANADAMAVFVR